METNKQTRNNFFIYFKNKARIDQKSIVNIISGLFILLFIYAAATKLLDYEKFKAQLGQSPMLTAYANQIAWFIPAIEITLSFLLYNLKTRLIALYMSFTLMTVFSAYITAILKFSSYIPCSCGGILEKMTWGQHLIFNLVFVLLGAIGVILQIHINNSRLIRFA